MIFWPSFDTSFDFAALRSGHSGQAKNLVHGTLFVNLKVSVEAEILAVPDYFSYPF